jgi:transcription antitermination factor NusG
MARNDWVALVTDPAAEYVARTELERFGLRPYLPQLRKRWTTPHTNTSLMRRYPLFPRYILLPVRDSTTSAVRVCRGLRKLKPILCDAEGRPWRASDRVIAAVREAEERGEFDEVLSQGDKVQLAKGVLAGVKAVLSRPPAAAGSRS